jgi:hypothetical protein
MTDQTKAPGNTTEAAPAKDVVDAAKTTAVPSQDTESFILQSRLKLGGTKNPQGELSKAAHAESKGETVAPTPSNTPAPTPPKNRFCGGLVTVIKTKRFWAWLVTAIATLAAIGVTPVLLSVCWWRSCLTATVLMLLGSATLLHVHAWRARDRAFLARMTAESSETEKASDWTMPWNVAHTHLRYNARRMRSDAGLSLSIILVSIIIGLLFFSFADKLTSPVLVDGTLPSTGEGKSWFQGAVSITSLIARLAIGGLLIFLVQVLAGIYRYSIRMAAFYEGRAAALLIGKNEPDGVPLGALKHLVDWLAGDKVEFDNVPKAPTELLAEVATSVATATANAIGKANEKGR